MLFNSLAFLIFFPVVTAAYFILPHRQRWALLLAASCFFYMYAIPKYIIILAISIVIDYVAGILIEDAPPARRRTMLIVSIFANVGLLVIFKYCRFFNDNVVRLAEILHWNYPYHDLLKSVVLPVGLSFHTFQAMSYTIEVYRGHQRAERHFGIYALYVMFYPQLVAGPIERPQNLLHQFREYHAFEYRRVSDGLKRMLWGMFKKVVIADRLYNIVTPVYDHPHQYGGLAPLVATVFFAFQIYCDFSGYSDIAIGSAQVMGFKLMENFRRPYFSKSIAEFWTRWHISLSTWFKDYLYISLGGNRVAKWKWYRNLMIVFLVSGFWHGAAWTYIIWGFLHGMYLILALVTRHWRARVANMTGLARHPRLHDCWKVTVTFTLVTLGWIFFRAESLHDALYITRHLFSGIGQFFAAIAHGAPVAAASGLDKLLSPQDFVVAICVILSLEVVHLIQRHVTLEDFTTRWSAPMRWLSYEVAVLAIVFLGEFGQQKFIYFQF